MIIDKDKLAKQIEGGKKWQNSSINGSFKNGHGTLVYPTGFGKSFTALLVCENILNSDIKYDCDYLFHITVPSIELQKQWKVDIIKYFSESIFKTNFNIRVINTVIGGLVRVKCYLSVLDEVHEFINDNRIVLMKGEIVECKFILGLTASYRESKVIRDTLNKWLPVVDYVSEEYAIEKKWISNYIEYNLGINLSIDERKQYDYYSECITEILATFENVDFTYISKCLGGGTIDGVQYNGLHFCTELSKSNGWKPNLPNTTANREIQATWSPFTIMTNAKNMMAFIRRRMDLLNNSNSKLNLGLRLIKKFSKLKIITFSQSTDFTDSLYHLINDDFKTNHAVRYHSSLVTEEVYNEASQKTVKFSANRQKKQAILDFSQRKSLVMCTASALDKGFNDKDIDCGITFSRTSKTVQYKQRNGRVKRINEFALYDKVLIINIYFKLTKDEDYLRNIQKMSFNKIINVNEINEIKYD